VTVSANGHVTPNPAAILAFVDKNPVTIRASLDARASVGSCLAQGGERNICRERHACRELKRLGYQSQEGWKSRMGFQAPVREALKQRMCGFPQSKEKSMLRTIYRNRAGLEPDFAISKDLRGTREVCGRGGTGQAVSAQFGMSPVHNRIDEVKDKDPSREPALVPNECHEKL
jgi:hypothetical protein